MMKRVLLLWLSFFIAFSLYAEGDGKYLKVLFTNDVHANIKGVKVDDINRGGFAQLSNLILSERKISGSGPVLTVDAGDMSMGSFSQSLFRSHAPELVGFSLMRYDAITLGNHDFDFGTDALALMLESAVKKTAQLGIELPAILLANLDVKSDKRLSKAFETVKVRPWTLVQKGGLKIAIIGVMGESAYHDAPDAAKLNFIDPAKAIKRLLPEIRSANPDYLIVLSHGGTISKNGSSPDEILAGKVPEIDLIVSGHDHDEIYTPISIGSTLIVSSGWQGRNLGVITLLNHSLNDYRLVPVYTDSEADTVLLDYSSKVSSMTDSVLISTMNLKANDSIVNLLTDIKAEPDSAKLLVSKLGFLVADSYCASVRKNMKELLNEPIVGIAPAGTLRFDLNSGLVRNEDVFRVLSLGEGDDYSPGHPLLVAYLYGRELKDLCELNASVASSMPDARLWFSGMKYTYSNYRLPFTRVLKVEIADASGIYQPLDPDRLYPVVAGMYSVKMLGLLKRSSFGLLSATPKDANGAPISNFKSMVLKDQNGRDVKEWIALASFLKSDYLKYSSDPNLEVLLDSRIKKEADFSVASMFVYPNKLMVTIYFVLLVLLVILFYKVRQVIWRL